MTGDFIEGWEYFAQSAPSTVSAELSNKWAQSINEQYSAIEERIAEICKQRAAQDPSISQGFLAEMWHTETFNLNAAIRHSNSVAEMLEETTLGSADIRITNKDLNLLQEFSAKYYKTGAASAHEQSISVYEKFCRYASKHNIDVNDETSFQNYLTKSGLKVDLAKEAGLYNGQMRLIPAEQIEKAIEKLNRDIAKASAAGRAADIDRLIATKDALCGVIGDGVGVESIALSRNDTEKIIRLYKSGKFDLAEYIDIQQLVSFDDILHDAINSGTNAALLSTVLSIAPDIIRTFRHLIASGSLDIDIIKKMGASAITASTRGFITGSISAAITASTKLGFWGTTLKNLKPETIGAITALTYQLFLITLDNSFGKTSSGEMKDEILRAIFSTGCSVAMGSFAALINPAIYLLGSLVGSIVGSLLYSSTYKAYISFCADTGFTLFGLVEQDYTVPEDIAQLLGLDYIKLDEVQLDRVSFDSIQLDEVSLDEVNSDSLGLHWVKRGVIGMNKIGYVVNSL